MVAQVKSPPQVHREENQYLNGVVKSPNCGDRISRSSGRRFGSMTVGANDFFECEVWIHPRLLGKFQRGCSVVLMKRRNFKFWEVALDDAGNPLKEIPDFAPPAPSSPVPAPPASRMQYCPSVVSHRAFGSIPSKWKQGERVSNIVVCLLDGTERKIWGDPKLLKQCFEGQSVVLRRGPREKTWKVASDRDGKVIRDIQKVQGVGASQS